jgi:hypothetical protein
MKQSSKPNLPAGERQIFPSPDNELHCHPINNWSKCERMESARPFGRCQMEYIEYSQQLNEFYQILQSILLMHALLPQKSAY